MDVQERLDWLTKHDASVRPFTPQPYVQLANVLRRQGMPKLRRGEFGAENQKEYSLEDSLEGDY